MKKKYDRAPPIRHHYVCLSMSRESYHVSKVSQFRCSSSIDVSSVQVPHEADVSYLRRHQIEQVSCVCTAARSGYGNALDG